MMVAKINGAFYCGSKRHLFLNTFAFFSLIFIVTTFRQVEGADSNKKKSTVLPCLSPELCRALHRCPCNPRGTHPCGPCIYGIYLTQKGHEKCYLSDKKHPQIHKLAPGDDPDFTAVPEAAGPVLLKPQPEDVNGAFNFLADFARFQQQEQDEQQQQKVAARGYSRLQEDDLEDQDSDDQDQQPEQQQFADNYLQSLLGRLQQQQQQQQQEEQEEEEEEGQQRIVVNKNKMEEAARKKLETTTQKILSTKAPAMSPLVQHQVAQQQLNKSGEIDFAMIALLTCLAVAAALGVIVSVFCFVKIQRRSRSSQRFDYSGPGNGTGIATSKKGSAGSHDSLNASAASAAASKLSAIFGGSHGADKATVDKKLANNATLYHFEHHKKEMMAAESADVPNEFGDSDAESGDENDENDYTVYECPGLAPTGEMQVDNPLFRIKQQASQPSGGPAGSRVSPPVVVHSLQGSPK